MPLEFESVSHGGIVFGFFNIKSDMLLLENHFFFADDFCKNVEKIPDVTETEYETQWRVWHIPNRLDIGDLMSAMYRIRHIGFLGELYIKFPFPDSPQDFKQQPEGWQTQEDVKTIIDKYGTRSSIPFRVERGAETVHIGEYAFRKSGFERLIRYVWEGGYPKWRAGERPDYVMRMKGWIERNDTPLFKGIQLP